MWSSSQQQHVLALLRKYVSSFVAFGFIGFLSIFVSRQFVRLIKDNHIPTGIAYYRKYILPTDKVDRSNDFVGCTENIRISSKQTAIDKCERYIELDTHFVFLPLFGQATRSNNQNTFNNTTHDKFLQKKACHNRFSCTGIVSQQETNLRLG